MPKPNKDDNKTGRLPYLSLRLPITGANKNWVIAYTDNNQAPYGLASLIEIFFNWAIRSGITGMIKPHPITSIKRVMNINPTAALRSLAIYFY